MFTCRYIVLIGLLSFTNNCLSEVVLDGSTGPNYNLVSTNSSFLISEDLGTIQGGNLFHSFSRFNLNSSETAVFAGSTSVNNIISRITGNQQSVINGTIQSEIPNVNFWFINPNGILFGENAKLDIGGSFYASTASKIGFTDGSELSSSLNDEQIFSMAEPESFGFLGDKNAAIIVNGSQLKVVDGETFALAGGNISVTNSRIDAGEIQLTANNNKEHYSVLDAPKMDFDIDEFSDLNISESILLSSGSQAQGIFITAGKLVIENSHIESQSEETTNNHLLISHIDINSAESYLFNSTLAVFTEHEKNTHINVRAKDKMNLAGSEIFVDSGAIQTNINISASRSLEVTQDSTIFSLPLVGNEHTMISNINVDGLLTIEPGIEVEYFENNNSITTGSNVRSLEQLISSGQAEQAGDLTGDKIFLANNSLKKHPCSNQANKNNSYFEAWSETFYEILPADFNPGASYALADIFAIARDRASSFPQENIGLYSRCN